MSFPHPDHERPTMTHRDWDYDGEFVIPADSRARVLSTLNRRVPLQTYPHYSDERFSDGKAQTVFGRPPDGQDYVKGLSYDYDDRLRQWDFAKHERAWKAASALGLPDRSADLYEAYLTEYFGEPIKLLHVLAGVNVSSGYPYVVFGYTRSR